MEDEEKAQNRRQFTSPEQKRVLEFVYQVNPRPNKKLQTYLSTTLEMSFKRVRVWFQNKRTREKLLKEPIIRSCDEIITLLTNKLSSPDGSLSLPSLPLSLSLLKSSLSSTQPSETPHSQSEEETQKDEEEEEEEEEEERKEIKEVVNSRTWKGKRSSHPPPSLPSHCNPPSPMTSLAEHLKDSLTLSEPASPTSQHYFAISKKNTLKLSPFTSAPSLKLSAFSSVSSSAPSDPLRQIKPKKPHSPVNISHIINHTSILKGGEEGEDDIGEHSIDRSACLLHNLTRLSSPNSSDPLTKEHKSPISPPTDPSNPLYSILMSIENLEELSDDEDEGVIESDEEERRWEEEETANPQVPHSTDAELAKKSPLIAAILYEGEEKVKELLQAQSSDITSPSNSMALHCAAKRGDPKIVQLLLNSGASPSSRDHLKHTALHHASIHNHVDVMKLLIHCASSLHAMNHLGQTPLHLAAENNNPKAVEVLLLAGADPDARDLCGDSPLHIATRLGNLQSTKSLLEHSARIDNINVKSGFTPLHELPGSNIVNSAKLAILRLFIGYVKGEQLPVMINSRTLQGETVMHLAAKNCDTDFVECLIEHHCDINVIDFAGRTPLESAIQANNFRLINFLIKKSDKSRVSALKSGEKSSGLSSTL